MLFSYCRSPPRLLPAEVEWAEEEAATVAEAVEAEEMRTRVDMEVAMVATVMSLHSHFALRVDDLTCFQQVEVTIMAEEVDTTLAVMVATVTLKAAADVVVVVEAAAEVASKPARVTGRVPTSRT